MSEPSKKIQQVKSVGLEIECPFRFYFPEVYKKHFPVGRKFLDMNMKEREALIKDTEAIEAPVRERIEKAMKDYGLTRGLDKYCEFILPPKDNPVHHATTIAQLVCDGVLSMDIPLSVHLTIGNVSRDEAFAILFFLELRYVTQSRIEEGFNEYLHAATWNRKGKCGMVKKDKSKLLYDDSAFELRTLKVPMIETPGMLCYLNLLLQNPNIVAEAKQQVADMGLPWKAWNKEQFMRFASFLKK